MANDALPREWQCPKAGTSESYMLGWINENTQQGQRWTQSQRGYNDWRVALDTLSGLTSTLGTLTYRSQISGHRLKTNIRVMTSGMANVRPMWGYNAGNGYEGYALALNKTAWALHQQNNWSQKIKEWLVWSAATCTGWLRPVYRRDMHGRGTIQLDAFGMPSVFPTQLPQDGDFQRAYTLTLLEEVPIYEAHWRFPMFQERLRPTSSRYWYATNIRSASRKNALTRMWDWFGRRDEGDGLRDEYCPLRWTSVNDATINDTGQVIPMGDIGSSWYYEVPYWNQEIPDGKGGTRKANEIDAQLYPQKRMVISGQDCVLYDGPGFNWHGQRDLIPISLDKWPWEPMGLNLVHDAAQLQFSIDKIDRGAMDKINALQDLPLGYSIDGVNQQEATGFDPMEPRARIGFDPTQVDQPFKEAVPLEVYKIGAETLQMRQIFQDELDYIFQTRDIVELSKAKALGKGSDSLENLVNAQGPIVKDITLAIEAGLTMVGGQVGSLICQYFDTGRIMQYAGAGSMTMNVFDYDPTSIIPSHMPDEIAHDPETQTKRDSAYSPRQRARWFGSVVQFYVMPHSAHELTQSTLKLGWMQLKGRGAPISWNTIMKSWDVPNPGNVEGNTELEKYRSEQEDDIRFKAQLAKEVQALGVDQGLVDGMGGGGKPNGVGHKGGRPPSGQAMPVQKQKGDGRPVVSESS